MAQWGRVLVVWFPWVSSNEVNLQRYHALHKLLIYFLMTFALTLVIEMLFNFWRLRKYYPVRDVLWWTILVNIASYIFVGSILYGFSFGLF